MAKNSHVKTGKHGEDLACDYLQKRGYTIIERNYRCGRNEIDIIAQKGSMISFVEVKTRHSLNHGHPVEAITEIKQKEILKAVQCYVKDNHKPGQNYRFEMIAFVFI
jgi:putative endonuclease